MANQGYHVLLSNPKEVEHIFDSDKYLVSQAKDYADYTYGRLVGKKSFSALSNSPPVDLSRWKIMRDIFATKIASGPNHLDLISQYSFRFLQGKIIHTDYYLRRAAKKLVSNFDKKEGKKKYDPSDDETNSILELGCSFAYGSDFCHQVRFLTQSFRALLASSSFCVGHTGSSKVGQVHQVRQEVDRFLL